MSITLLTLAITAVSTGAQYLRNSGINPSVVVKQAEPLIKDGLKSLSEYIDAAKSCGWVKKSECGEKILKKEYYLPDKKARTNIENAIVSYFESMTNVKTTKTLTEKGCIIEAKSKFISSAAGLKLNVRTEIITNGNQLSINYYVPTMEEIEVLKAVVFANPLSGIGKLAGVHFRHEIPLLIDKKVQACI